MVKIQAFVLTVLLLVGVVRGQTAAPSFAPTAAPSFAPTAAPTLAPTAAPTLAPTAAPSFQPTAGPTLTPTAPTASPTAAPTRSPSPEGPLIFQRTYYWYIFGGVVVAGVIALVLVRGYFATEQY